MPDGYVELDPDTVATAGTRTAATSEQWASWAGRVENLMRTAAGNAMESVVTTAIEGHLSAWNPRLQRMATNVETVGTNATSASYVMTNADHTSTTALGQQGAQVETTCSALSRPITH